MCFTALEADGLATMQFAMLCAYTQVIALGTLFLQAGTCAYIMTVIIAVLFFLDFAIFSAFMQINNVTERTG